jgi:hypothetical protein
MSKRVFVNKHYGKRLSMPPIYSYGACGIKIMAKLM